MKKFIKIFLITILVILINIPYINAVGIDMDLDENTNNTNNTNNNNTVSFFNNTIDNDDLDEEPIQKVSTTSTVDEEFHLTVSDIINIILISVGVVLILLGIAILIRLK